MTVVMVSSELMELRSICDRIAIVAEGKVVDVLETDASDADFRSGDVRHQARACQEEGRRGA